MRSATWLRSVGTILSREWVLNQREMQEGGEKQERYAPEGARKKRVSVSGSRRPAADLRNRGEVPLAGLNPQAPEAFFLVLFVEVG